MSANVENKMTYTRLGKSGLKISRLVLYVACIVANALKET